MKRPSSAGPQPRGFALVVTLSLMVLLTILAVGLLSLSAVSLRAASEGQAIATARANARLALMLALGDLQKSLGTDRAVTATSGIVQSPGKPGLTGVWSSWDYDPSAGNLDYISPKTRTATDSDSTGFRRWLVSSPNPNDVTFRDFASSAWSGETITLADKATFGGELPSGVPIVAGRVPLFKDGNEQGAYAWHVSDESVKARINVYRDPRDQPTLAQQCALLAGHRPDVSVMNQALNFLPKDSTQQEYQQAKDGVPKITDLGQVELLGGQNTPKETIRKFRNDLTPYSLGVLADVRKGGLKRDLSSIFEMSASPMTVVLPPDYQNKGLYQSTHGITGESDPRWSTLSSYYNIFRKITNINTTPTYSQPPPASLPLPSVGSLPTQPTGFSPVPVVAKMQVIFSMVARNNHWGGPNNTKIHLMFTPLVTLHNPYNINISFDMMEVGFDSMPMGFQFTVGTKTNGRLIPFNELYKSDLTGGWINKSIVMKIANWYDYDKTTSKMKSAAQIEADADAENNQPKTGPITMKPGQTLICAPYLNPTEYFNTNGEGNPGLGYGGTTFFDYANSLSRSIKAKPGYNGPFVGLDLDWIDPYGTKVMDCNRNDPATSAIQVICGPTLPTRGGSASFDVKVKINTGGTTRDYGGIRFEYPALTDLNGTLRTLTFNTTALDAFVDWNNPISNHANAKPFALFSASARTTSGGINENGQRSKNGNAFLNGRFSGKPFLFNNPALPIAMANLKTGKLGNLAYELSLEPVTLGSLNSILQIDATNRTRYLTGNTTNLGTKSGSYLELPLGPLQTIADFRRSNALASPFAPSFVQPVGNSTASPLMSTGKVTESGPDGYKLLDHSVLANHALYDGFYFSTFATDGGTPADAFNGFMAGTRSLAAQAFQPYLPVGTTAKDAATTLFSGGIPKNDAYKNAALYQLVRGPFNVNSTSVNAWKAKLASMRGCNVPILTLLAGTKTQQAAKNTPIFPMALLNSTASDPGLDLATDAGRENRWNGFRQLTDAELDTLARRIVDEVKSRGPFLSMSEFVNRRIGADSALTQRGALEAAIEASGINNGTFPNQVPIHDGDIADPAIYGFKTPAVVTGNPAAGAPGWICQGDLMRVLEPAATVRSDTFVIRVCGEAKDGTRVVRAYAEAVCQRIPEYVEPVNAPASGDAAGAGLSRTNKTFGRCVRLVSFRWLSSKEI